MKVLIGTSSAFPVPNKYVNEIISSDLSKVMNKLFEQMILEVVKAE